MRSINDYLNVVKRLHIQVYICLLKDKNDVEDFRWFAAHIREYSKPGQFYGRTYYYYYLDDYKYWWMDPSVEECDLINRDKVK